jgi:hypothetical protein
MGKHYSTSDETSIIDSILSDVNAIIPNFFTLTESYRLLVGAAEEISNIPSVPFEIFERSLIRCDRTGALIDILLELLCCKIKFSSQFLSVTSAPVDIIEQLASCDSSSRQTAEAIVLIEAMRRLLDNMDKNGSCFGPPPVIKPFPPQPPKAKPFSQAFVPPELKPEKELSNEIIANIENESQAAILSQASFFYPSGRSMHQKNKSPLSRKHI